MDGWKKSGNINHPFGMLTQPMDPEKKSLNFIFPTKYVIPKSLKFSHWLSEDVLIKPVVRINGISTTNDSTGDRRISGCHQQL